jgi:4-amino-4-deoxy-L-arabinose transferase-like glycosyltransferase
MDNKKLLVTILILAAVIRFATVFLFLGDYYPTDDAAMWHQAALNFLNGRGLIINEDYKAYRTPVPGLYFAAVYSVFGVSIRAVQIANVLLGVLTVWLAYDLVRRSFGDLSAFLASGFVSFYPMLLLYTGHMLSETLVIMLIALTLWLIWVLREYAAMWFAPIGIVLGLATLTREAALPIAVLVGVWTFAVRRSESWLRRCLPGLVMLAFLVLTVAPWAIRNYVLLGRFVPLTTAGGWNLWLANNPQADGTTRWGDWTPFQIPEVAVLPEVERGLVYQKRALEFIKNYPGQFLRLMLRRLPSFWHFGYHGEGFAEIAFLIIYLPMLILAAMGAWAGWRSNRDATLLLLVVPVSLTAVHMVFLPAGRYRLPAELVICMFAGIGACWGLRNLIESKICAKYLTQVARYRVPRDLGNN